MVRVRPALLGLVLVLSGACAKNDGPVKTSAPGRPATVEAPAATAALPTATVVPDVVIRDVATGGDVNLRALGLPERPTLYWFWAPH